MENMGGNVTQLIANSRRKHPTGYKGKKRKKKEYCNEKLLNMRTSLVVDSFGQQTDAQTRE